MRNLLRRKKNKRTSEFTWWSEWHRDIGKWRIFGTEATGKWPFIYRKQGMTGITFPMVRRGFGWKKLSDSADGPAKTRVQ